MNRDHKGAYCQYYTEMCYCTILKIDLLTCAEECPFFTVRDRNHKPSRDVLEECRFLQHDGTLDICFLKGDIILSCAGCKEFDSIDRYLPCAELKEFR